MRRASVASRVRLIFTFVSLSSLLVVLALAPSAGAQQDNFLVGNGQSGAVTFGNGTHIPNALAPVSGAVSVGATSITRGTITAGSGTGPVTFADNRLVMIYQANGYASTPTSGDQSAVSLTGSRAARWEFARISTVAGATLNFTAPLINAYDAGAAQVIAVPEYTTVTLNNNGSNVTGRAWDGTIGGVVVILANNTINFSANGTIQANSLGFRGGVSWVNNPSENVSCTQLNGQSAGGKGEGIWGQAFSSTTPQPNANQVGYGNFLNGAGGGDCFNAGGAGGGNGGQGGRGGNTLRNDADGPNGAPYGGLGGSVLTYNAYERAAFGGGGGAADRDDSNNTSGGAGGGFVLVRGQSLTGTGTLSANGAAGTSGNNQPYDGAGGGGAGGVVVLRTVGNAACTTVRANGGVGANNYSSGGYQWTPGGGGGGGRVYVQKPGGTCTSTATGGANGTNGGNAYNATAGAAGSTSNTASAFATPTVSITAPANSSYVTTTTPTISGTSTANATIYVYVDGALVGTTTANGSGNWSYVSAALSQGAHNTYVYAELEGSASANTSTNNFTVDSVSPTVSISSPTNGSFTNDNTPSVTFTVTEANPGTTTCSVDAGAYSACSSVWTTGTLADGGRTLNVRHTDLAGNVTTSSVGVIVDTTAPVINITSLTEGTVTNDTTPTFSFTITETNSGTTTCSVDGGAFASCSSPFTTGVLAAGAHNLRVRHVDLAGNTTTTPQRNFTIDVTAPTVVLSTPANGTIYNTTTPPLIFTVTDSNPGVNSQCNIDGGGWNNCTSGTNLAALSQGSHTIQVRNIDLGGNTGTSATHTFTVDTVAPTVTLTSPANGAFYSTTTPALNFSVSDANPGATSQCNIDGGGWNNCTSGTNLAALSTGSHTIQVRNIDLAGNTGTSATHTFTIDTTAPTVTLTSPANGASYNTTTPALNFSVSDTNPGVNSQCNIDGGGWNNCTSGTNLAALSQGSHTIQVRNIDLAGNTGTSATHTFTVDTVQPAPPTITTPSSSPFYTTDTTPTVAGTAEANSVVRVFDGPTLVGTTTANGSGNWSLDTSALSVGSHTITATAQDAAGNISNSSSSRTIVIDTSAPSVSITTPANGAFYSTSTPPLSFIVTDANPGTTSQCNIDGGGWNNCTSGSNLASLGQGSHTIQVRNTDLAGNTGTSSLHTFTVDTSAPSVTLTTPADGAFYATATPPLNFSVSDANPGANSQCNIDGGGWNNCTSGSNLAALGEGSHTIQVRNIDQAGNTGLSATHTFTVDTVVPNAPIITTPVPSPSYFNTTAVTIAGTSEPNATITLYDGPNPLTVVSADGSGNWTYAATLPEGGHEITAWAADAAGNISPGSTSKVIVVDLTAPVTPWITTPVISPLSTNDTTPTVGGTSEVNATIKVYDGLTLLGTTTSSPTGFWSLDLGPLAEGSYTLTATATDAAGNVSDPSNSKTIVVDTTSPNAPVITTPASSPFYTSNTTPTISGTAEAGSTVSIYDGATLLGTTVADGSGDWSFVSPALSVGSHDITATATDDAGNTSTPTSIKQIVIDTSAPTVSLSTPVDGFFYDTTTPPLNFSVSDANPGSTSQCNIDGAGWNDCTSGTDLASLGQGSHTIQVRNIDLAGNTGTSATHTFTVDTVAPNAPVITTPATSPYYSGTTAVTIAGTAEPGSTVTIYDGSTPIDTVTANGSGDWTYAATLAEGSHVITATATDAAGNEGAASNSKTVIVDTTDPAAPVITTPLNSPFYTNDTTPTVGGTAEPGSTVTVYDGATPVGTATADGNGDWSLSTSALGVGSHTITATATDAAGNEGPASGSKTIVIDTTAPNAPVLTTPATSPLTTNDDTPTIGGTAEAGATVNVYDGTTLVGTTTADGSGNWSLDTSSLADGSHTITATATDAAGNVSDASNSKTIVVDTIDPAAPAITSPTDGTSTNDRTPTISGTAEPGSTVTVYDGLTVICSAVANGSGNWSCTPSSDLAVGDYGFTAKAVDAAGNESGPSSTVDVTIDTSTPDVQIVGPASNAVVTTSTPQVTFTATDNLPLTVQCRVDGGPYTDCSSPWTTPSLTDGSHTVDVRATDEAGNVSTASVTFTVDTQAPTTSITDTPPALDNDPTPTFEFTSDDPSATFECRMDGGPWTACTSPWTSPALGEGEHTFEVKAKDANGNEEAPPQSFTWTLDTTAPLAPIVTAPVDGSTVRIPRPPITGTAEANSVVTVSIDGNVVGTTTTNGSGNWTFTPPSDLSDGPHSVSATARDAAGNPSSVSSITNFIVDTTPPDGAVTPQPNPDPTQNPTFDISSNDGTATTTCSLNGGPSSPCSSPYTPTVKLPPGTHTLVVTFTDPAGNTSQKTITFVIASGGDPVGCDAKGITISDLSPSGRRVTMRGFARLRYVGQTVTIRYKPQANKIAATAVVQADGSFTAVAKAPAKSLWLSNKSLYRATVGDESTQWTKLSRRVQTATASYSGGKLTVRGILSKPLFPKAKATITARTGCDQPFRTVGAATVKSNGSFTLTTPYAQETGVIFVKVSAVVSKGGKKPKALRTYSYVIPVVVR